MSINIAYGLFHNREILPGAYPWTPVPPPPPIVNLYAVLPPQILISPLSTAVQFVLLILHPQDAINLKPRVHMRTRKRQGKNPVCLL